MRRRAREDAARNFPAPDAEALSPTESAILDVVAAERLRVDRDRDGARVETERKLRLLSPSPPDLSGPALTAKLALKQIAGRLAHECSAAATHATQARAELLAFKRHHDLRRAAHYPESTLLQAGLLFVAALFEALFSAALFAEDDARGLLGGAVTAIGLSGANVTIGFLGGYLGLRYLQHISIPIRVLGGAAFAASALLALMLNLFAADWRDRLAALNGGQLDLGSDAGFHLWSLLQLQSPQAIILLMLGAGVWVFAALKGYSGVDDPYPDYGKMDRAEKQAAAALSEIRSQCRTELEAPINVAKAEIETRIEKTRTEFAALNRAFDEAALTFERLDSEARALVEARWEEDFAAALDDAAASAGAGAGARASPIIAGVRAVAADPLFDAQAPTRRLVLVSDLLEHNPQGFSLYVEGADYSDWRAQFPLGPPDLSGVALRLVPLDRPELATRQAEALNRFWPEFFMASNAQTVSADPMP